MTSADSKSYGLFPRGCAFGLLSFLLGICITAGTALYQRQDYTICQGILSAGFPLPFMCDHVGSSPISSWGKIDVADWFNMNPRVFLLDLLLINALLWLCSLVVIGLTRIDRTQDRYFTWGIVACIGYILLFLVAFLSFQYSPWSFWPPVPRTPTLIVFTPTPFGTPLPSPWTSFPTIAP